MHKANIKNCMLVLKIVMKKKNKKKKIKITGLHLFSQEGAIHKS